MLTNLTLLKGYRVVLLCLLLCMTTKLLGQERESIFDKKVNLYEELMEVPVVPRWEQELGIYGQHILAGKINLWTETFGEGPPLVLICGGPGTSLHYFHPHFQEAAKFSKVILYDLRGVGLSDYEPDGGYNVLQAVEDLEQLRVALDIDSWVVLGLSFGAAIAQYYAIEYPERVRGMVFVGGFVPTRHDLGIGSRQRDYQSKEEVERIGQIYSIAGERTAPAHSDQVSPELQAKMVYNGFMNGDWKRRHLYRIPQKEIARYARYEWQHDKNYYQQMLRDGLSLDFSDHFLDCPTPTLIYEGKWDLAFGTDKAQTMQRIFPKAQLVYMENAGHITFEDEPELFFQELEKFIAQLAAPDKVAGAQWKEKIKGLEMRKK